MDCKVSSSPASCSKWCQHLCTVLTSLIGSVVNRSDLESEATQFHIRKQLHRRLAPVSCSATQALQSACQTVAESLWNTLKCAHERHHIQSAHILTASQAARNLVSKTAALPPLRRNRSDTVTAAAAAATTTATAQTAQTTVPNTGTIRSEFLIGFLTGSMDNGATPLLALHDGISAVPCVVANAKPHMLNSFVVFLAWTFIAPRRPQPQSSSSSNAAATSSSPAPVSTSTPSPSPPSSSSSPSNTSTTASSESSRVHHPIRVLRSQGYFELNCRRAVCLGHLLHVDTIHRPLSETTDLRHFIVGSILSQQTPLSRKPKPIVVTGTIDAISPILQLAPASSSASGATTGSDADSSFVFFVEIATPARTVCNNIVRAISNIQYQESPRQMIRVAFVGRQMCTWHPFIRVGGTYCLRAVAAVQLFRGKPYHTAAYRMIPHTLGHNNAKSASRIHQPQVRDMDVVLRECAIPQLPQSDTTTQRSLLCQNDDSLFVHPSELLRKRRHRLEGGQPMTRRAKNRRIDESDQNPGITMDQGLLPPPPLVRRSSAAASSSAASSCSSSCSSSLLSTTAVSDSSGIVSYSGTITSINFHAIVVLDHKYMVNMFHFPPTALTFGAGLRVGTRLQLHNVHLVVDIRGVLGFSCCSRSSIEIVAFAPCRSSRACTQVWIGRQGFLWSFFRSLAERDAILLFRCWTQLVSKLELAPSDNSSLQWIVPEPQVEADAKRLRGEHHRPHAFQWSMAPRMPLLSLPCINVSSLKQHCIDSKKRDVFAEFFSHHICHRSDTLSRSSAEIGIREIVPIAQLLHSSSVCKVISQLKMTTSASRTSDQNLGLQWRCSVLPNTHGIQIMTAECMPPISILLVGFARLTSVEVAQPGVYRLEDASGAVKLVVSGATLSQQLIGELVAISEFNIVVEHMEVSQQQLDAVNAQHMVYIACEAQHISVVRQPVRPSVSAAVPAVASRRFPPQRLERMNHHKTHSFVIDVLAVVRGSRIQQNGTNSPFAGELNRPHLQLHISVWPWMFISSDAADMKWTEHERRTTIALSESAANLACIITKPGTIIRIISLRCSSALHLAMANFPAVSPISLEPSTLSGLCTDRNCITVLRNDERKVWRDLAVRVCSPVLSVSDILSLSSNADMDRREPVTVTFVGRVLSKTDRSRQNPFAHSRNDNHQSALPFSAGEWCVHVCDTDNSLIVLKVYLQLNAQLPPAGICRGSVVVFHNFSHYNAAHSKRNSPFVRGGATSCMVIQQCTTVEFLEHERSGIFSTKEHGSALNASSGTSTSVETVLADRTLCSLDPFGLQSDVGTKFSNVAYIRQCATLSMQWRCKRCTGVFCSLSGCGTESCANYSLSSTVILKLRNPTTNCIERVSHLAQYAVFSCEACCFIDDGTAKGRAHFDNQSVWQLLRFHDQDSIARFQCCVAEFGGLEVSGRNGPSSSMSLHLKYTGLVIHFQRGQVTDIRPLSPLNTSDTFHPVSVHPQIFDLICTLHSIENDDAIILECCQFVVNAVKDNVSDVRRRLGKDEEWNQHFHDILKILCFRRSVSLPITEVTSSAGQHSVEMWNVPIVRIRVERVLRVPVVQQCYSLMKDCQALLDM
jgi:hypothetical protein